MSQYKSDDFFDKEGIADEEYYFQISDEVNDERLFVLIIYDIVDNKRRVKFAKTMQGYGFRVQKSAFEAMISKRKYEKLIAEIPGLIRSEDNVRLYKIRGRGQVYSWGQQKQPEDEDTVILI